MKSAESKKKSILGRAARKKISAEFSQHLKRKIELQNKKLDK